MFKRRSLFVLAFLLTLSVSSISFASFIAKVVGVTDGDTITVLQGTTQTKIRLYGIDCPESGQAYGKKAKELTSSLTFGHMVKVDPYDVDRYNRTVAVVTVDGVNVSKALIKNGYAWRYTKYCKAAFCDDWLMEESKATAKGLGLWNDKNPMAPWEWRKSGQKAEQVASNIAVRESQEQAYKESVSGNSLNGNTNSHIYHNAGCRFYNCKNCTQTFGSPEEAQNAGYRACKKCGG